MTKQTQSTTNSSVDNHQTINKSITIVSISARQMMEKMRSGFFKAMKPCVYNPGSNEIKMIAIQ